jgi:hypothetical protein
MAELTQDEYQKEYDAAAAKLEAAAQGNEPEAITAPAPEAVKPPESAPAKLAEAAPAPVPVVVDELAELRAQVEKANKALKDTQAWGTKNAQEVARLNREHQQAQRDANRPAILDANPDLAAAIEYVTSDPAPQQQAEDRQQAWFSTIDTAHPGIFAADADPELVEALVAKRDASGGAWEDPLVAIRDITAEKIAFAERQIGKRFAVESAKQAEKSAMSVPGAGGGGAARKTVDADLEAVQRIQNMSDADFAKEVKKAKGF